ncbi:MAG: hypothetical protein ACTSQP_21560 [Promethearchaeota archaeon]
MFNIKNGLKKDFQKYLLKWAEKNVINYPWRKYRTPYRVLISEIFLTRTKAKQVIPVYIKFMEKFPNLNTFLSSNYSEIFNIIKSLGLLYRAQKLESLKIILKMKYKNEIPHNYKELKALPGIGQYSANAILCFGFNERRPLLDSNFIRIFERVFNIKSITKNAKSDKFLWQISDFFLPKNEFIKYNYAVLDLGGNICQSRKPKCQVCPLTSFCNYFNSKKNNH